MKKEMRLSLLSEFFSDLVSDFDQGLNAKAAKAEDIDFNAIKFSASGELILNKSIVPDETNHSYPATREIIAPVVEYKISFDLHSKDTVTGKIQGKGEMIWDAKSQEYIIRTEDSGQTSLFDDNDSGSKYQVDERGSVTIDIEYQEIDESHMLTEPPRQLPALRYEIDVDDGPDAS